MALHKETLFPQIYFHLLSPTNCINAPLLKNQTNLEIVCITWPYRCIVHDVLLSQPPHSLQSDLYSLIKSLIFEAL